MSFKEEEKHVLFHFATNKFEFQKTGNMLFKGIGGTCFERIPSKNHWLDSHLNKAPIYQRILENEIYPI